MSLLFRWGLNLLMCSWKRDIDALIKKAKELEARKE